MQKVIEWFKSRGALFTLAVFVAVAVAVMAHQVGCRPPTPAQIGKAEADLCKARAAWKVVAAAAGGALDPKPGTPRATLETAEDALCAEVPK